MDVTPQVLADLNSQFRADYQKAYDDPKIVSFVDAKAEKIYTPGVETNVQGWLAETPIFQKVGASGNRQMKRLAARAYVLKNEDYQLGYKMHKNDIKYDRISVFSNHAKRSGRESKLVWDRILTVVQLAGRTTKCYDGQNFYDTAHLVNLDDPSGATFQNFYASPFDLTVANFATAYANMAGILDANGDPFGSIPTVLEVGHGLRKKALDVINAGLTTQVLKNIAGSENVAMATLTNTMQGQVDVIVNPRLPATSWYLHATDVFKPFVVQVESEPTGLIMRIDPSDPVVFHTSEFEFGNDCTGAAGYTFPQYSTRCDI